MTKFVNGSMKMYLRQHFLPLLLFLILLHDQGIPFSDRYHRVLKGEHKIDSKTAQLSAERCTAISSVSMTTVKIDTKQERL